MGETVVFVNALLKIMDAVQWKKVRIVSVEIQIY